MAGKPVKTIFKVDSPYTTVTWPQIASTDQAILLDMLCNLLSPIGRSRAVRSIHSAGKSTRKRKSSDAANLDGGITPSSTPPPMPEISKFLTVGLNSTTRHLETLMALASGRTHNSVTAGEEMLADNSEAQHLAVVFLPKSRNDTIYAHLPLMSRIASSSNLDFPATRLVPFSPAAESRIAAALGLPRAGVIGILEGAPGSGPLIEHVRQHVPPVEVPWIEEATKADYLPLQTRTEPH